MIRPPNFATFSDAPNTATDAGCRISRTVARGVPTVIARVSPSLERRRALFFERRDPLVRVVRAEDTLRPAFFQRRGFAQAVVGLRVDTLLDRLHCERRAGRQAVGDSAGFGVERIVGNDAAHEPELEGPLSRQILSE